MTPPPGPRREPGRRTRPPTTPTPAPARGIADRGAHAQGEGRAGRLARAVPLPTPLRRPGSWGFEEGDEIVPGRSVLKKLGGGHRYEAFLAWDDHLRATVVAKVVRPDRVAEAETLQGLADEAAALAALNHPVILRGFGAEAPGGAPASVARRLEGPRLSSLIRRYGPLGREQLAPLAIQLAAATHYMHAEGWLHLDMKPANVIMGAPPRLIDLSVARPTATAPAIDLPIGTDSYMAPEQCQPLERGPVGPAADVFGLGVTLYRAATGERPFESGADDGESPRERWPQLAEPPLPLPLEGPTCRLGSLRSSSPAWLPRPGERPAPAEIATAFEAMLGRAAAAEARAAQAPLELSARSGSVVVIVAGAAAGRAAVAARAAGAAA